MYRDTDLYQHLKQDPYRAVGVAEGFVEPRSEEEVCTAWQVLHDTRLAYQLQGFFGRTARRLIEAGEIEE